MATRLNNVLSTVCIIVLLWTGDTSHAQGRRNSVAQNRGTDAKTVVEAEASAFQPKAARTEAAQDRLAAATHFAQARLLLKREDRAGALRRMQRAWRYDPDSADLARDIVGLASALERHSEAIRYAVLAAERFPNNSSLLAQLGRLMVQRNQLARGLKLYEKAIELGDGDQGLSAIALRLESGRVAFRLEQYEKAAASLAIVRDAILAPADFGMTEEDRDKLVGDEGRVYAMVGEAFLRAKRTDDAVPMFKKANDAKPRDGLLAYNLARVAHAKGDGEKAREQLDAYLASKLDAGGSKPYDLLKELIAASEEDESAANQQLLSRLTELHEADAKNMPLTLYFAARLVDDKQLEPAKELLHELLKSRPNSVTYGRLADVCHQLQDASTLLDVVGDLVERTESLDLLGEVAERIVSDDEFLTKVIEDARLRVKDSPESLGLGGRLGVALFAIDAEHFDVADEFLEHAIAAAGDGETTSDADIYETVGLALFVGDQTDRATTLFQRAIDAAPEAKETAKFYYYQAAALALMEQLDEAIQAAEKAAALRPDAPQYQVRPAWVLYSTKQYAAAEQRYLDLLERYDADHDSDDTRTVIRQARFVLSNICVATERFGEAAEWLEQVLDEFPEDVGALNDLGYVWVDRGEHLQRALRMVQRAVDAEPDNIAYRDSLGWAYFRLGRYEDAARELERATSGDDPDGVILDHLGDVYLKLDRSDNAIEIWKRAAEALRQAGNEKQLKLIEAKIANHSN